MRVRENACPGLSVALALALGARHLGITPRDLLAHLVAVRADDGRDPYLVVQVHVKAAAVARVAPSTAPAVPMPISHYSARRCASTTTTSRAAARARHRDFTPLFLLPSPSSGPEIPAGTQVRSSVSVRATCSMLGVW